MIFNNFNHITESSCLQTSRYFQYRNIRAIRIIKFSCYYLLNPNFSTPKELFGMGQYAEDSWKLFCGEKDDAWRTIQPQDKILKMYVDWRLFCGKMIFFILRFYLCI